jgi:hypothetical protein
MTGIDGELLAERTASVLRHLDRVAAHLPAESAGRSGGDRPGGVDMRTSRSRSPPTYGDALRRLAVAGLLDEGLAARLAAAAGSAT